ncbi:hypothetical protein GGS24DRAFT_393023 [Hypoxylon argillaceum]|nr:hypothetical protein GGS24DRAFT_393023 [Hypoxylon argillaceum]KAI1149444.1 hypothetical protein F4825DRAFT_430482 [Nemania diffusa]
MASAAEPVPQVDVLPPADKTVRWPSRVDSQRPPSPRSDIESEAEAPLHDTDSISIDSMQSIPDFTGRKMVAFDDDRTTTAYEAWELVGIEDRYTRQSWKSFCGLDFGARWVSHMDGCVLVNPLVSFDQGELADMHEEAIRLHKVKDGVGKGNAYAQDLANRAYNLPSDFYDKLQHLLEDKTVATNRTPYRQREWRVVVLQPSEFRMTDLLPERKRKGLFSWMKAKQAPVTRTWFVVIRGQEVKATKEDGGWKAYNRHSNPWWKFDNRETKEGRGQHKDIMKKFDKARFQRRRYRPRPRPSSLVPSKPRPLAVQEEAR